MKYAIFPSPLGDMYAVSNGQALTGLYFEGQKFFPELVHAQAPCPVLERCRSQVEQYFAGRRHAFDLPIAPRGTPFQLAVWQELQRIPFGDTTSYGALARRLGRPRAMRAVGAAVGRNPLSLIVPCHRVIGADGSLTGYAGGLHRKQALLEKELAVPV